MDSDSSTNASTTTIIPFDGKGRDPNSLVGRKIKWYYKSGKGIGFLTFKCQDGIAQFYNELDLVGYEPGVTENNDISTRLHLDPNLKSALSSLSRSERTTCTIEEACTGKRKVGSEEFRVIGIKLQGMREMGFIYCKKSERTVANLLDPDDSDVEWEPEYYRDLLLTASRIRY
jgi:hypothetical protein